MVGQGYLILLDREDSKQLFAQKEPASLQKFVMDLTQSKTVRAAQRVLELGTTWDGIHRCLTEGTLEPDGGEPPLNHAILGGKQMLNNDECLVSLVRPDMALYVAEAVSDVRYDDFHKKYLAIDPQDYGQALSEKDFEKIWVVFQQLVLFYETGAQDLSAILFVGRWK